MANEIEGGRLRRRRGTGASKGHYKDKVNYTRGLLRNDDIANIGDVVCALAIKSTNQSVAGALWAARSGPSIWRRIPRLSACFGGGTRSAPTDAANSLAACVRSGTETTTWFGKWVFITGLSANKSLRQTFSFQTIRLISRQQPSHQADAHNSPPTPTPTPPAASFHYLPPPRPIQSGHPGVRYSAFNFAL